MATTQQYSLRWNNYFRHLTYALDNHRADNDFVDVTLVCDGRKIKAHKVVLSSCSAYFKEIFKENPHPHPVIIFKFIKFDDLNAIIEFMYQGEVNVQQEALQSFLQTAELLAVQGLTAEDKEKPKMPLPLIDEQKIIKTIPSTIRPLNDTPAVSQTSTQTLEIPAATLIQAQQNVQHHIQTQMQHLQVQQHQPQTLQVSSPQTLNPSANQQTQNIPTVTTNSVTIPAPATTVKKRKITFSEEDDNLYATDSVDYAVKDEQTIVKTTEMTFLRSAVKIDLPEYIVSDVDDHLSEDATPQTSQDGSGGGSGPNVTQYTSEYEILEEQEMDEKFNQSDADNSEIIEMGRLLNQSRNSTNTSTASHNNIDDPNHQSTLSNKGENKGEGNPTGSKLVCKICNRKLQTTNALRRHIASRHTKISKKDYKCSLCSKLFKTKWSLSTHNSRYHKDLRPVRESILIMKK